MKNFSYISAYEDGTECSETSAYTIQTPGNCSEESIQHSEQGESLKSNEISFCAGESNHATSVSWP
jgi:hypothetical protein